jgi:hypothetical protein
MQGLTRDVAPEIGGHWTPTSNGVHGATKAFSYVMKADTRIEGPWTDEQEIEQKPPLTRQLQKFMEKEFYPWQKMVYELCQLLEDRWIHCIIDKHGNKGKSIFAEYLEYLGLAFELPTLRSYEDLMQFANSFPPKKVYLIDMPRGLKKDKMGEFYSGLESLKNGITIDKRYKGMKRRFDRPQVFVFTNAEQDETLLSPDRWKIYDLTEEKTLELRECLIFT